MRSVSVFLPLLRRTLLVLVLVPGLFGSLRSLGAAKRLPIHWWSGDGSFRDRRGVAHGDQSGDVTFAEGKFYKAFRFIENEDGVSFGPGVGNFGTNDFTVTLWVRATSGTEIISKRAACGPNTFWDIRHVDGLITAGVWSSAGITVRGPMSVAEWHHVALVRFGLAVRLSIDGVLQEEKTSTASALAPLENTAPLQLGEGGCGSQFQGLIDEVRIYALALTPEEVLAQAQAKPISLVERAVTGTRRLNFQLGPVQGLFSWLIEPGSGETYREADLDGIRLEATDDFGTWSDIPDALRISEGRLEIVDPQAPIQRGRFYRLVYGDRVQ